ncbi:MAG: efflux RND transporter permease subunit [Planctomycetaceae bacterium]|nr:efflux RND transporter permease subunit [Planctomycetaceae bacterium]
MQRPITELADIQISRGFSEINRVNQKRSITVSADVDESIANAKLVIRTLQGGVPETEESAERTTVAQVQDQTAGPLPGSAAAGEETLADAFIPRLLKKYPHVQIRWEGQQEQDTESISSLFFGLGVALLAMYVLLTMEFNSYGQPVVVMLVIPFGLIGAVWGHYLMGLPLTLFSMLGLVALTGIVVNDSIVLVDFINARVRGGTPLEEALVEAGTRRFRPVMLTSLTTIAGLLPILTEESFQAQLVIPMATSVCFGLMLSTVLVLVLVPTLYLLYTRVVSTLFPAVDEDEDNEPSRASQPAAVGTSP